MPYACDDRDKKILECLSKLQTNQHFIPEEADDKIKNSKWFKMNTTKSYELSYKYVREKNNILLFG